MFKDWLWVAYIRLRVRDVARVVRMRGIIAEKIIIYYNFILSRFKCEFETLLPLKNQMTSLIASIAIKTLYFQNNSFMEFKLNVSYILLL